MDNVHPIRDGDSCYSVQFLAETEREPEFSEAIAFVSGLFKTNPIRFLSEIEQEVNASRGEFDAAVRRVVLGALLGIARSYSSGARAATAGRGHLDGVATCLPVPRRRRMQRQHAIRPE